MNRHDTARTRPWSRAGTEHLLRLVDAVPDADLRAPSALPGWTRAHVVGHLARNAEALTRLATWARTGIENPMYADPGQRARDIETSARASAAVLRRDLVTTAHDLDAALSALDDAGWRAPVRSALGRTIPAAEIPWMRVREVWLHAVDLNAGAAVDDLPDGVVDALLDDATAALSAKEGCPAAVLVPVDRHRAWTLGPDTGAVRAEGSAADLLAWLVGRGDGTRLIADAALPPPPRWI